MKSTFQGGDDKLKIVLTPDDSDSADLQKFCERKFLVVQKHYFSGSDRLACLTIEHMDDIPEKPHTAHHSE